MDPLPAGFDFDPLQHSFRYLGRTIPSVTQILTSRGLDPNLGHYTDDSAQRGVAVHEAVRLISHDILDWASLDPEIVPYVEAFLKYQQECRPVAYKTEQQMVHQHLFFGGIVDFLGLVHGAPAIVDYKSGPVQRHHELQVGGGYRSLARSSYPDWWAAESDRGRPKCYLLELKKTGTYALHRITQLARQQDIFLKALDLTRWAEG